MASSHYRAMGDQGFWKGSDSNPYLDIPGDALEGEEKILTKRGASHARGTDLLQGPARERARKANAARGAQDAGDGRETSGGRQGSRARETVQAQRRDSGQGDEAARVQSRDADRARDADRTRMAGPRRGSSAERQAHARRQASPRRQADSRPETNPEQRARQRRQADSSQETRQVQADGTPATRRRPEPKPAPTRQDAPTPAATRQAAPAPAPRPARPPRHQTVIATPLPPRPTIKGSSMAGTDRLARAEAARRALDTNAYYLDESQQPRRGSAYPPPDALRVQRLPREKLHFWRWFRTLPIVVMVLFCAASLVVSLGLFGIDRWLYPVEYNETINEMAEAYGVDPLLVASVIRTESGWDPKAVSRMGAVGLMQLLPGTAADLAANGSVDASRYDPANLLDPETNIAYGTAYLRDCLSNTEDLDQAIAAYNAGIAAAQGWAQSDGSFEEAIQYPETTAYLERVKQNLERYQQTYPEGIPAEEP